MSTVVANTPSITAAVGAAVRALREAQPLTQEQVARLARDQGGFPWTRSTVLAIERGDRALSYPEAALLCVAFGVRLEELLPQGPVELNPGVEVNGSLLRAALAKRSPARVTIEPKRKRQTTEERMRVSASGSAELKAAKKLGVSPQRIAWHANRLWKRSLTEQRDQLVREKAPLGASPRSIQAIRGRVTLSLLKDLEADMNKPMLTAARKRIEEL